MSPNFARHEQFLRIWRLLQRLESARRPLADDELLAFLKDTLGLQSLSPRTLGRDCDFLVSCGYPIERFLPEDGRKQGWQFVHSGDLSKRWTPAEPVTLLEMTALLLARKQLRFAQGTVLWTGIESLWGKLLDGASDGLAEQVATAESTWHVIDGDPRDYAARPRLVSLLAAAIGDSHEIELRLHPAGESLSDGEQRAESDGEVPAQTDLGVTCRFQPYGLIIWPPSIGLIGFQSVAEVEAPVFIDIKQIAVATNLKKSFPRSSEPIEDLLKRAIWSDGRPVEGAC